MGKVVDCGLMEIFLFSPRLLVRGGREETDFKRCVFNQK